MRPPKTIVALPSGAASPIVCDDPVCTNRFLSAWMWRNDDELLFYARTEQLDARVLYAWRPREGRGPRPVLRTQGTFERTTSDCALGQGRPICIYEALDRPGRLVAIDVDRGRLETLYDPNPDWARFDLGRAPLFINVALPSGAQAPSYLVLPPDYRPGQRLPLVIATYLCDGFLRGGTGDEYPIYPLAAQGFAVLCHSHLQNDAWEVEGRRSQEDAQREQRAPGDPFQRRIQAGLDTIVADLDRQGLIDTARIGLTGLSQGAGTVSFALYNMPTLTAAIASSASSPEISFTIGSPEVRRLQRRRGIDSLTSPRLETLSVARNVDRVRAPFLVNVSDQEMSGSVLTVGALEDAGRAVEMYVFPDEFHGKWQPAHRLAVYNHNIDWMNFWLRGVESGLSGDAGQYARWRAMRENQCRLFGPEGTQRSARPRGSEHLTDDGLIPWYCRPGAMAATAN